MSTPSLTPDDLAAIVQMRAWLENGTAAQVRQSAGARTGEMARAVGVTERSFRRYEDGNRVPRSEVALRYHAVLTRLLQGAAA